MRAPGGDAVGAVATLWRCLLAAVAAGALGDAYLFWGRLSATAFAWPALLLPLFTAAMLLGTVGAALCALRPVTLRAGAATGGLALLVGAIAVLDLLPPVARDELTHHLAIPALYVRAQRIIEVSFAEQSYYPMLVEMAYTPLLGWLPDQLPKYLHLLYGLGSAALVSLYVRRRASAAAAALAGLLVLSTPVVTVLSASAYVDLGLLFYATGALVALLLWAEEPQWSWLLAAALMAGFAGATKYNGLLVIPLLGAGAALVLSAGERDGRRLGAAAVFAVVALLPAMPWFIKNGLDTGNPIFPLFNTLLHGRPLPVRASIDILTQRRLLYGESWLDILLIPLRLFTTGREGDPVRFDGVFNPVLLLGLAAAFGRGASRRDRLLAWYAIAYALLASLLTALRVRYSIVIVAPLVLLTVDELVRLHRAGGLSAALANLALGGALLFSAIHFTLLWTHLDPLPYLTGAIDRRAYLARQIPEYGVLQVANQQLPESARIYLGFLGNRSYYCEREYVYDFAISGVTLRQYIEESGDAAGIAAHFHTAGISHMVFADALLQRYLQDTLTDEQQARWRNCTAQYLRLIYTSKGFGLYEIATGGAMEPGAAGDR